MPLQFSKNKRGRPTLNRKALDRGTKELQAKRKMHLTKEPLDICLEKKLISSDMHWAGLHLRWLYTIKFGAPGIRGIDYSMLKNSVKHDDQTWREKREQDYNTAVKILAKKSCKITVMNVCIFNKIPKFLLITPRIKQTTTDLQNLQNGLHTLAKHWTGL